MKQTRPRLMIVPALLADRIEVLLQRLRQAESFTGYVQIDMMDGSFVPEKSFQPQALNSIDMQLSFELHLMVEDPQSFLKRINNNGLKKVIFHYESKANIPELIDFIKERGLKAGLAVKPETPLADIRGAAELVDVLLFLTVDPGRYGSPFKPEVLKKVARARRIFPDKLIGVDGGISLDNLKDVIETGADYACIGSRIFLHGRPAGNYKAFTDKANGLEMSHI
ncbi:MAG: hypothetical protein M0Z59_04655 [Nitrospiraceae bacterium]|nr:hypothetical protein [Nitrospiraceae bacterium]